MPAWAWPGRVQRYGNRPFLWNVTVSFAVLCGPISAVFLPPMLKSWAMVPTFLNVKVTVSGFGIDALERWNLNSLPVTETAVVAAACAAGFVRAEASPAGVSAARPTAATMSFFMIESSLQAIPVVLRRRFMVGARRAPVVGVPEARAPTPRGVRRPPPPPSAAARRSSGPPRRGGGGRGRAPPAGNRLARPTSASSPGPPPRGGPPRPGGAPRGGPTPKGLFRAPP